MTRFLIVFVLFALFLVVLDKVRTSRRTKPVSKATREFQRRLQESRERHVMGPFLILLTLIALAPIGLSRVTDMGHCDDVASLSCSARDYWPTYSGSPTGVDAYWLRSSNQEVCFVTQQQYGEAKIGNMYDCQWRRRTQRIGTRGTNDSHQGMDHSLDRAHPVDVLTSIRLPVSRLSALLRKLT